MITVENMRVTVDGVEMPSTTAALPSPVVHGDGIVLAYGSTDVVDHAGAATLEFQMFRPAITRMPWPSLDAEVRLYGDVPAAESIGGMGALLFRGWIDGVTEHPRERYSTDLDGVQFATITATDAIGVLKRTKVGQPPWPEETPTERASRIYATYFDLVSSPFEWVGGPGGVVAPLDVDSMAPWDVLTRTFPRDSGLLATDESGRIGFWDDQIVGTQRAWIRRNADGGWQYIGQVGQLIDAHLVEDLDRTESYATGVSSVTISQWYRNPAGGYEPAQRSITLGDRNGAGAALTLASDYMSGIDGDPQKAPVTPRAASVAWAEDLLATGTSSPPALGTIRLPLHLHPRSEVLLRLLLPGMERWGRMIALSTPAYGVAIGHAVTGVRFELSARPGHSWCELTTAPAELAMYAPLTFDPLAKAPMTFSNVEWTLFADFATAETLEE